MSCYDHSIIINFVYDMRSWRSWRCAPLSCVLCNCYHLSPILTLFILLSLLQFSDIFVCTGFWHYCRFLALHSVGFWHYCRFLASLQVSGIIAGLLSLTTVGFCHYCRFLVIGAILHCCYPAYCIVAILHFIGAILHRCHLASCIDTSLHCCRFLTTLCSNCYRPCHTKCAAILIRVALVLYHLVSSVNT